MTKEPIQQLLSTRRDPCVLSVDGKCLKQLEVMVRVLLVDNYDSYTWNLFQLVWRVASVKPVVVRNDEFTVEELLSADFTHIIISPGPGDPAVPSDFGVCASLIQRARTPCLGVCLGHQGLAWSLGGAVVRAPEIYHGRLSAISHEGTGLFAGLPQGFKAVRYHSLTVAEPLPAALKVTARCESGLIMGLEHRTRPLHGVQFHPESIETQFGDRIISNFLQIEPRVETAATRAADLDPAARDNNAKRRRSGSSNSAARLKPHVEPLNLEIDASTLFERAFAADANAFWLDSANNAHGMGQFSFMGAAPTVIRYFARTNTVEVCGPDHTSTNSENIFEYLKRGLAEVEVEPIPGIPFAGGFVGYLGYGVKAAAGIGRAGAGSKPDAELLRVDRFVAVDHRSNASYLVTVGLPPEESAAWCERIRRLALVQTSASRPAAQTAALSRILDFPTYKTHFETVEEWLRRGDSYEACYTYQIKLSSEEDPLPVYQRLRKLNPAPYSAYLQFEGRSVLCSSPERFVRIGDDGWVETKPIKGTCARHSDQLQDQEAKRRLAEDEKTRSENLMIVDLLRNDLGKVCDVGTVHVPSLMAVESYATVHQLVTTIRGRLLDDLVPMDCVGALFPGGSMTGAPKKRTVELLDGLEPEDRGIYSGSIGYFSFDGNVDLNIVIRTIVWESDNALSIGVGGALTIMSDPESEYDECRLKSRALLNALGI